MGNVAFKLKETLTWSTKECKIILLGLDAAGKTTISYAFASGKDVQTTIPTIGFNVESTNMLGMTMQSWDVGGRSNMRALWRHYYTETDGIVFVVDSSDRDRIVDAKEELNRLLSEDKLQGLPLLVFANKQDLPNAMNVEEMQSALELSDTQRYRRSYMLQPCCARTKEGVKNGFLWLQRQITRNKYTKVEYDSKNSENILDAGGRNEVLFVGVDGVAAAAGA